MARSLDRSNSMNIFEIVCSVTVTCVKIIDEENECNSLSPEKEKIT